ncbi:RNA-directed DNA polymerase (reverse transcriptase)-related family protein [Rhynchospora pubera]|uniref:RNA-directed DNA polymerase (Reverse transcriptase)-related family protein n=1 Tax=Rhynchospora pubera TaxID=906938 RepID=A0AAV8GYP7_9POAL|nr:RNA-directed DNA polymerase (reverse transcriptase)-related family protein [Rhynchospora pubera]
MELLQINGTGDGFIYPTRGLRQGCPMSPYCFIMVMEMLTRQLHVAQARELIRGVKLAPTCPPLTHVIYADDLILLGQAEQTEVQGMARTMEQFGVVSGLVINPTKSKLWCSRRCDEGIRQMVHDTFRADEAGPEEKYLGALLSNKNTATKTANMLLEKLRTKLTGWRSNMLSHAGRLVLLQSVLMSIPVYFMSVEVLPKGIIKKMESLIAKFFWGKTDQTRYMSFVSWQRICRPREEGGLGVRQLQIFGEALFLKLVWAMIRQDDKLWVHVCKGKYYPNLGFWRAANVVGASPLWRQAARMREFFKENIKWQIADGSKINALSQPWYPQWQVAVQASIRDRKVTVADLFDFRTNQWKMREIERLLGREVVQHITQNVQRPNPRMRMTDKLIWKYNKSGNYTVKDGYECLIKRSEGQVQQVSWKYIWKWKKIAPKVKIFMWRLLTNGLPLANNIHTRIQAISPTCMRCQIENEFPMHCFFFCHGSRMVWFGGPMGVRTDDLPLNICDAVDQITKGLNDKNIRIFCHTLWEIWLARNEMLFQSKQFDPVAVCRKIQRSLGGNDTGENQRSPMQINNETVPYATAPHAWQIVVDASWDTSEKAGIAFLAYWEGSLQGMGLEIHNSADPFQAEALALHEAVRWVQGLNQERGRQTVQIFCDCLILVQALQEDNLDCLPSWRARASVASIASLLDQFGDGVFLQHVRREAVQPAHNLANYARRTGYRYQGIPMASVMTQNNIGMRIDTRFFQQVLEGPP